MFHCYHQNQSLKYEHLKIQHFHFFYYLEADSQSQTKAKTSSPVNMSVLKRHIPVTKNPDLMFFGVSAFGSDWFSLDALS
jgi:hypothetical protein